MLSSNNQHGSELVWIHHQQRRNIGEHENAVGGILHWQISLLHGEKPMLVV